MTTALQPSPRVAWRVGAWRSDLLLALIVYALTRVWGAALISQAAKHQLPSIWTGPRSGYFDLAQLWDAQWYRIIATQGYPVPLPMDAAGVVQQNAWAFFPGFPYTVKVVMAITSLPFSPAAVLLNVVLGGCAVVVVLRLLQRVAGRRAGLGAVVLLCALPSAPVLQIAYSESLALLLLALALLWLVERKYALSAVAVLLLALTRPVVAPFAVVVLVHLIVRWRSRQVDPFPVPQRLQVIALGLFSASASLIWPVLVQVMTGVPSAYVRIQGAWRSGGQVQGPFEPALGISRVLWGEHGPRWLVLGSLGFAGLVLSPLGRALGAELRAWVLAYPTYLLAVLEPWTSSFRYAVLAFPLLALVGGMRRVGPLLVVVLALVGLAYQVRWVNELLLFTPPADYPP